MKLRLFPVLLLLFASTFSILTGCAEESTDGPAEGDDAPFVYVPDGKMDDYRSTTGREYSLLAIDSVQLPAEDADLMGLERDARIEELVQLRFKALSFFLYQYLASKSSHDSNAEYGGFRTTIRQQTFENLDVEERANEPGTFDFIVEAEAGGPNDLLSSIPLKDDGRTFDLIIPELSTSELESGSYSRTYNHFDPTEHDQSTLTTIEFEIDEKPSEPDAYPNYTSWFEDGVLDVAIHIGGDYNDERYDLQTAEDVFNRLQSDLGLTAPVGSFEDLRIDSGPFTGEFDANGQTVALEVYLIHPDMQKEDGVGFDGLLEAYRQSAATRDIVIYDGHAGYDSDYSGVVVHYNPRYAIPADDFDELDLPNKYQLFFFNGCKTYTSYADAMYAHPNKTEANLDIITTVNFSWLSEMTRVTTDFLGNVVDDGPGTHIPRSYDNILADLNRGRSWDVIYGVHGLSDNPRLSPYALVETLCSACGSNSECPGADNLCVRPLTGEAGCAVACTDDSGCPEGYECSAAAASGSDLVSTAQCVPTAGACQ